MFRRQLGSGLVTRAEGLLPQSLDKALFAQLFSASHHVRCQGLKIWVSRCPEDVCSQLTLGKRGMCGPSLQQARGGSSESGGEGGPHCKGRFWGVWWGSSTCNGLAEAFLQEALAVTWCAILRGWKRWSEGGYTWKNDGKTWWNIHTISHQVIVKSVPMNHIWDYINFSVLWKE